MLEVTAKLGLKTAKIRELNTDQIKDIAGSPEIKGVKGTDRRKYIIDLMRIQPRDANYPDVISETACVVREELISAFNRINNSDSKVRFNKDKFQVSFNSNLLTTVPV